MSASCVPLSLGLAAALVRASGLHVVGSPIFCAARRSTPIPLEYSFTPRKLISRRVSRGLPTATNRHICPYLSYGTIAPGKLVGAREVESPLMERKSIFLTVRRRPHILNLEYRMGVQPIKVVLRTTGSSLCLPVYGTGIGSRTRKQRILSSSAQSYWRIPAH